MADEVGSVIRKQPGKTFTLRLGVRCDPRGRHTVAFLGAFLWLWAGDRVAADGIAERDHVVVLANSLDEDSVALARYYAGRRGIPEANLIALPLPTEPVIRWPQFVAEVFNPLRQRLIKDGWIGGVESAQLDPAGRPLLELKGHRIAYLVTCRGVPLRIEHDPSLLAAEGADLPPRYLTNRAAVDAELSLLTRSAPPTTGVITNPLYKQTEPSASRMASVIRVARLDGPDPASVRRLVDSALAGEARGLVGRAYVDMGGPHKPGDLWMEAIAKRIRALGFDLDLEVTSALMGLTDRMDAPCLYFGWHNGRVVGPLLNPGFAFAPGAVAVHIHSFSAGSMKNGWVAQLVRSGAAATVGNVHEPYLQFTHDLSLFFEVLEEGGTVGEAAWYALPGQSWQGIVVGDPLYRPFKRGFEEQWAQREGWAPDGQYLVLRRANLLEKEGTKGDAQRVVEETGFSGLALAYRRALTAAGAPEEARIGELTAAASDDLRPDEWGLGLRVLDWLRAADREEEARRVAENLGRLTEASEAWRSALDARMAETQVD